MLSVSPSITPPYTQTVRSALLAIDDPRFTADLLFLEAWEMAPSTHLGAVLRASQIRRANPVLAAALAEELRQARSYHPGIRAA